MFSRFIALSISIFTVGAIGGCSSDPAENSTLDAGTDASTSDADASNEDVITTPEALTCLELADCHHACAGDTECIAGCDDDASETASADLGAIRGCFAEAHHKCVIDETVLDFRCLYEECADQGGSCTAPEPVDPELNCIELGMCIATCEGEGCQDACRAEASGLALDLFDAMVACSDDPVNRSACEAEEDLGACLYERCKEHADACNEHAGDSCEQILSCMNEECSTTVCSFSCLEKGTEDGKAGVLIAFDGMKQCQQDGVEACYNPEGTSWDCILEKWAGCAAVCP